MQGGRELSPKEEEFLRAARGGWFLFGLWLGDEFGILKALPRTKSDAICVADLSIKTGVNRRYLDEWLGVVSDAVFRVSVSGCERVWMSHSWHDVLTNEGGKSHLVEMAAVFVRAVQAEKLLRKGVVFGTVIKISHSRGIKAAQCLLELGLKWT